jgi:hypothetical protein
MNTEPNPVRWLFDDAQMLYQNGRKHGAILLMLCAVDALARRRFPKIDKVGERFEAFLKLKMRRPERPQVHNIFVPSENRLLTFEYLIYKFLRCPLVHSGSRLEALDLPDCAVCLDWDSIPLGISVDSDGNRVVLGGELVVSVLSDALRHELANESSE